MIKINKFGGISPKIDPANLPEGMGQVVHNANVTGGALAPWITPNNRVSLHDGTSLKSGIAASEVPRLGQPIAPTQVAPVSIGYFERLGYPSVVHWLNITVWGFTRETNLLTGDIFHVQGNSKSLLGSDVTRAVSFSDTGFDFLFDVEWENRILPAYPSTLEVWTPRFQVGVSFDPAFSSLNGPRHDTLPSLYIPLQMSRSSPVVSPYPIPLYEEATDQIYAYLELADAMCEILDGTYEFPAGYHLIQRLSGILKFNLNYVEPRRKFFYYASSLVSFNGRESRPSPLSNKILVQPGMKNIMNVSGRSDEMGLAEKVRLYRSITGGDDFELIAEVDREGNDINVLVDDRRRHTRREPIPPFGDAPYDGDTEKAEFLEGSFLHPGAFAVAAWDQSVWFSDKERLHAWPREYTVPIMEDIMAIALTGNTVLVFTETTDDHPGRVYGVTGMDPRSMTKQLLTESAPLLNKLSLGKIGDTVYYATSDGIAAATGGGVQVISGAHLTHEQWQSFNPPLLTMETADNALILTAKKTESSSTWPSGIVQRVFKAVYPGAGGDVGDEINVLYDIEEEQARIVTFDIAGGDIVYRSKPFEFPEPTAIDYVRVISDSVVKVTATADGVDLPEVELTGKKPVALEERFARTWEFTLRTEGTVQQFEAFDRQIIPVDGDVRLTPETSPCWRATRLSFPDHGSFCAGSITIQGDSEATITLTPNEGVPVVIESYDGYFLIESSDATEWTIDVSCDSRVEEVRLFARKPEPIQNSIREIHNGVIPPWTVKEYRLPEKKAISSIIVHTKSAESVDVHVTECATGTTTIHTGMAGGVEFKAPDVPVAEAYRFSFGEKNHIVSDLQVYFNDPIPADNGLQLSGPNWLNIQALFQGRGKWAAARTKAVGTVTLAASGQEASVSLSPSIAAALPRSWNTMSSWTFDFSGVQIENVIMLPWRTVSVQESIRAFGYEGIPEWMFTRYEFPDRRRLTGMTVHASQYPVYVAVIDESSAQKTRVEVPSNAPVVLDVDLSSAIFEFWDAASGGGRCDGRVQEVIVLANAPIMVGADGLNLSGLPSYMNLRIWFPACEEWAVGVIKAREYPISVEITPAWDGSAQAVSVEVNSASPFLLPRTLGRYSLWTISAYPSGDGAEIESITFLPWRRESLDIALRLMGGAHIPAWLYTKYELPDKAMLTSMKIHSDRPVTARLYKDNEDTATDVNFNEAPEDPDSPEEWSNDAEAPIMGDYGCVDFHFVDRDDSETLVDCEVDELMLFAEPEQLVGEEPIVRLGRVNYQGLRYRFPNGGAFGWASVNATERQDEQETKVVLNGTNYSSGALPYMGNTTQWTVGVHPADAHVQSLMLYPLRIVPVEKMIRGIGGSSLPPDWLYTIWEFPALVKLRSVYVDALEPLKIQIAVDGNTFSDGVLLDGAVSESRIDVTGGRFRFRLVDLSGNPADHLVREVMLYAEEIVPISNGGVVIRGAGPGFPWRNKTVIFPETGSWDVARIRATDYDDIILKLNNTSVPTWNGSDKILPSTLPYAREWEIDVSRTDEIQELILLPREIQRVEQGLWRIRREQEPFSWLCKRAECASSVSWTCARVVAEKYPVTLKIYHGLDTVPKATVTANNGSAFRLPKLPVDRKWRIDVECKEENAVREVALATSMERLRYD